MARVKLPKPGKVGEYTDEQHMRCAAQHVAAHPGNYTEAYLDLARRGRELPPQVFAPVSEESESDQ